jgi:hypothetical protein
MKVPGSGFEKPPDTLVRILEHQHIMGIFKKKPVCRLSNEEEETISHTVFECEVMARRRFNLLELINPEDEIPSETW